MFRFKLAFTLAEMMVVLLIASIVLACMAPAITTRVKADKSSHLTSPWRWADNDTDAYFSAGSNQAAMIGQRLKADTDSAKLIINNSTGLDDMILFKNGDNVLGSVRFQNDGIRLGTSADVVGQGSVGIGIGSTAGNNAVVLGNASTADENGTAIGNGSSADTSAIVIGRSSNAFFNSIVIGNNINNTSENSISIGRNSSASDTGAVAVGDAASGSSAAAAIGPSAKALGSFSVAIGNEAKADQESTVAIGNKANANTLGSTAIGANTLAKNTDGIYNTAVGMNASGLNTTGSMNTALGYKALYRTTTGGSNTAVGYLSADMNTTGSDNTAIGKWALFSNDSGSSNTAIGSEALFSNDSGSNNTAIGADACANVYGSNKTCIGAGSGPESGHDWAKSTDKTERIFIGSKSKFNDGPAVLEVHNSDKKRVYRDSITRNDTSVVINGNLIVKGFVFSSLWSDGDADIVAFYGHDGDQMEYFGTPGGADTMVGYYGSNSNGDFKNYVGGTISVSSDRRLKNVGKENLDGLAKLRKIKVFNYTFKKDKTKTPQVGVIAQDLQKIFPNAVKKGADGFLRIRMEDMFYAVINAIKELDSRVTRLEKENKELRARLEKLEAKMK